MKFRKSVLPRQVAILFLVVICYGLLYERALAARIITLQAEKFRFIPGQITVKQGEEIELHITSKDRMHGFSIPDLKIREDIIPGKVSKIKFTAERSGRFGFLCDIFCGAGHGGMRGQLLVEPDP